MTTQTEHHRQPDGPAVKSKKQSPMFRWSYKVAVIAGIDVYVHGTFLFLLAFVAFRSVVGEGNVQDMVGSTLLIVAVFGTVLLHEFGHALMARRFGIGTQDITLLPIGGIARLDKFPEQPGKQLLVALAGPAVNVAIAALLLGVLLLRGQPVAISGTIDLGSRPFLTQLMWINVSLALFNLMPGYPMDGGRILRALLAMRMPPEQATQAAARVGQGVAVIFGVVGLLGNPMLILIAVFVWLGAKAEHSVSEVRLALAGLSVRDAMITDFKTLALTDLLSRPIELTLAGFQQDFPVLVDGDVVGILTHTDLLRGLSEHNSGMSVQQTMRGEVHRTTPSDALNGALTRMRTGGYRVLVVLDHDELVGLVTLTNIGELLAMHGAGMARANQPAQLGSIDNAFLVHREPDLQDVLKKALVEDSYQEPLSAARGMRVEI